MSLNDGFCMCQQLGNRPYWGKEVHSNMPSDIKSKHTYATIGFCHLAGRDLHKIYPERRRDLQCSPSKTVVVVSCPQVDGFSSLFDKGEHGGK